MDQQDINILIRSIEKLTNPVILRHNLVQASLYLTSYEVLKSSIVDQIRNFYARDFTDKGEGLESQTYILEMQQLHKNRFIASCLWLQQGGAITQEDIEKIKDIRDHRNRVAHELLTFLIDADLEVNIQDIEAIQQLLQKIDRWWIKEVYIPTDHKFDGAQITEDEIRSGSMIIIDAILNIALEKGDDSK